jgi:uncharacterized protein involved in response to NO
MIFGYAIAVIAGFLLTAVQNWTNIPTPKGRALFLLSLTWLVGRFAVAFSQNIPFIVVFIADMAFIPALGVAVGRSLVRAGNKRNYLFLVLLSLFAFANGLTHFGYDAIGIKIGLSIVLIMITIIGGRVIPMFTERPLGLILKRDVRLDKIVVIVTIMALLGDIIYVLNETIPTPFLGWLFLIAAIAHAWRLTLWKTLNTLGKSMVWVLHSAFVWFIIGLLLKAAMYFGASLTASMATHALTTGTVGVITLGFMSRVALGHTGRPLESKMPQTIIFIVINMAALVRVFVAGVWPHQHAYWLATLLWMSAFILFVWVYTPILWQPRIDGRDG